ncbi:hypothetical protein HOD96_01610 [Candidatus Falkowbacteria bacterium]|jgi:hypothetical protein|nr:hypothetical protein [Candidatus Falkowbacteria bacterium]MBT4433315.1 hypothetical protein [Candidatus Falkowbacteria bacterium]
MESLDNFKQYSKKEAQEKGKEMQEKIKSGEAKDFREAEQSVEKEQKFDLTIDQITSMQSIEDLFSKSKDVHTEQNTNFIKSLKEYIDDSSLPQDLIILIIEKNILNNSNITTDFEYSSPEWLSAIVSRLNPEQKKEFIKKRVKLSLSVPEMIPRMIELYSVTVDDYRNEFLNNLSSQKYDGLINYSKGLSKRYKEVGISCFDDAKDREARLPFPCDENILLRLFPDFFNSQVSNSLKKIKIKKTAEKNKDLMDFYFVTMGGGGANILSSKKEMNIKKIDKTIESSLKEINNILTSTGDITKQSVIDQLTNQAFDTMFNSMLEGRTLTINYTDSQVKAMKNVISNLNTIRNKYELSEIRPEDINKLVEYLKIKTDTP